MHYKAILFDLDGVVIDTRRSVTTFWQRIAADHTQHLSPDDFTAHIYGCTADHTLDTLFNYLSGAERDAVKQEMKQYEAGLSYSEITGATAFLHKLRQAGIPSALVTSAEPAKVHEVQQQLHLAGLFTQLVTAHDIKRSKPDPECYLQAAYKLHVPPEKCVVFEDAISGVQAAVAAQTHCIGVQSEDMSATLIQAGASYVIPNFVDSKILNVTPSYAEVVVTAENTHSLYFKL